MSKKQLAEYEYICLGCKMASGQTEAFVFINISIQKFCFLMFIFRLFLFFQLDVNSTVAARILRTYWIKPNQINIAILPFYWIIGCSMYEWIHTLRNVIINISYNTRNQAIFSEYTANHWHRNTLTVDFSVWYRDMEIYHFITITMCLESFKWII